MVPRLLVDYVAGDYGKFAVWDTSEQWRCVLAKSGMILQMKYTCRALVRWQKKLELDIGKLAGCIVAACDSSNYWVQRHVVSTQSPLTASHRLPS